MAPRPTTTNKSDSDPLLMLDSSLDLEDAVTSRGGDDDDADQQARRRTVEYNGDDHLAVLTQMYGSVWPSVFPWCLATTGFTLLIILLRSYGVVDLTVKSSTGHNFMSLLVSFLLVTRATITYNRFMEARQHLSDLYRSCREIVQYACVLTLPNTGIKAIQWRRDVAYKTIVCLRMASAATEYRSKGVSAWESLSPREHSQMELLIDPSDGDYVATVVSHDCDAVAEDDENNIQESYQAYQPPDEDVTVVLKSMAHGPRTLADENFRAPIIWAHNLREQILLTRKDPTILETRPMHVNEELKIMGCVGDYVEAFHGHRKLITTPFPFPMVQMARTFLFFWVFSLPLVLVAVSDDTANTRSYSVENTIEALILMFFITYGFLGLEYVAVELDDPYGNDPNDFPGQRWSEMVFEDIYISIYKTDGYESACKLRERVAERMARGTALELYQRNKTGAIDSFQVPEGMLAF